MTDCKEKNIFKEERPLYRLMELAAILRAKHGCPWDREQTSKTLKPYLIEEAYEVYEAIENSDNEHIKEELGDLLYQVYAHAQIASEQALFNIDDIANGIIKKLVHRHPHVFADEKADSSHEVKINWEKIKRKEKHTRESILDGIPPQMPSLHRAYKIQQKASKAGFDWDRIDDVVKKIDEELEEFKQALAGKDQQHISEEIGDILFTIVNISRFVKVNPEEAVRKATSKFINRFQYIEKKVGETGRQMTEMTLEELDNIWEESKSKLKPDSLTS